MQKMSDWEKWIISKSCVVLCFWGTVIGLAGTLLAADKTYDVSTGSSQTESNVITNAYVNVIKTGGGTLVFNMGSKNTFTGYTDVQAGTLEVTTTFGNSAFGTALKVASGAKTIIRQDHVVGTDNDGGKVNFEIGGTLDMTDKWANIKNLDFTADGSIVTGNKRDNGTIPTIRVSGDITATGNASFGTYATGKYLNLWLNAKGSFNSDGDHTITVASGKTLNVLASLSKYGSGDLSIHKKGAGELIIENGSGPTTLPSGTTYIDEGKITLKGATFKKLTDNVVIAKGATLDMVGSGQLDGSALTIGGTFIQGGGSTHTKVTFNVDGAKVTGNKDYNILYQSMDVTENATISGSRLVPNQPAANINVSAGKTLTMSSFRLRNTTNQVHLTGPGTVSLTATSVPEVNGTTIYVDNGTLKMEGHHLLPNISLDISSKFDLGKYWNGNSSGYTKGLTFSKDGALVQGQWRPGSEGEPSYGVFRMAGNITANANANITDTTLLFANGDYQFTVADGKTLTLNQNIGQDTLTTVVTLAKNGNGTLQLANLNTRAEATTFKDREFVGKFNINDGTVLASGKISGPLTLAEGAELSPGTLVSGTMADTTGTLQLASFKNDGTLTMDIASKDAFDVLKVDGAFDNAGGDILLNVLGDYVPATIDTFTLFTGTLPSVANFVFSGNAGTDFSYNAVTGVVSLRNVNTTPEPTSAVLLLLGLGLLLRRTRR